ncbi:MAG: flagellar biosynthetic protein FliO [Chromatiales bacterium]|nr:flagellar biosynthetic protein FliO [Chromatiales bacterium]
MTRILAIALPLLLAFLPAAAGQSPVGMSAGGAPDLASASLRMVGGLAIVLSLVIGAAWLARRLRATPSGGSGLIEISSGISLGAREKVVLLKVGDQQVLVGITPAGMRTLHVLGARSDFARHMESGQ